MSYTAYFAKDDLFWSRTQGWLSASNPHALNSLDPHLLPKNVETLEHNAYTLCMNSMVELMRWAGAKPILWSHFKAGVRDSHLVVFRDPEHLINMYQSFIEEEQQVPGQRIFIAKLGPVLKWIIREKRMTLGHHTLYVDSKDFLNILVDYAENGSSKSIGSALGLNTLAPQLFLGGVQPIAQEGHCLFFSSAKEAMAFKLANPYIQLHYVDLIARIHEIREIFWNEAGRKLPG